MRLKCGIDIFCDDYWQEEGYKRQKDAYIVSDRHSSITLGEYIERFLLDEHGVYDLYESIYSMGNPYTLDEGECSDEAVALEIIRITNLEHEEHMVECKSVTDDSDAENLIYTFNRNDGGYLQQLKKYLNVDLNAYDYSNIQNQRERAKLLFFIYFLKNREFPTVNVLQMLSKPSMENIDNSFLGWETSNGKYIKFVKQAIEKEITVILKTNIKRAVSHIVNTWRGLMDSQWEIIAGALTAGYDCSDDIDFLAIHMEEPFFYQGPANYTFLPLTPLGSLYLMLIQNEYLGQIYDCLKIYEMTSNVDYSVPAEYIEAMREFQAKSLSQEDIEMFFSPKNIQEKAKYIYLKEDISKEDRRRIRKSKPKVFKFLTSFNLADPIGVNNIADDVTELLIISCLQSILLDKQDEIFNYTFHGFEGDAGSRKGKIRVNAALKKDTRPYDALQVYWIRKVMKRSYANMGDNKIWAVTSEFEKMCMKTLVKILNCTTIDEMLAMSCFYEERLTDGQQ